MGAIKNQPAGARCILIIVLAAIYFLLSITSPAMSSTFTITAYGAVNDSTHDSTAAINTSIDACAKAGGGRVIVPAGTYLTGPVQLQSNVELHLEKAATLLFSRSFQDYPLTMIDDGSGAEAGCRSPIWGEKLEHVSITGDGVIDGQGAAWRVVKKGKLGGDEWNSLVKSGGVLDTKGTSWYPDAVIRDGRDALKQLQDAQPAATLSAFEKYRALLRPNLLRLSECNDVLLEGVTFRQSASWNVHLSLCDHVKVQHVTIFNPISAQNGDGIDLDSCRDVLLADSQINAGDDAICIKSGKDEPGRRRGRPTEDVKITRCTVGTGHGGVVIGSEMSGGVRNITVSDCVFDGTDAGIRFKSQRGRGGVVEDVTIDGLRMSNIHGAAVLFDMYYGANPSKAATHEATPEESKTGVPIFRRFSIQNLTCTGAETAFQLRGLPDMPLSDIRFDHVKVIAKLPGMIQNAANVTLHDTHVEAANHELVRVDHVQGIHLENASGFATGDPAAAGATSGSSAGNP